MSTQEDQRAAVAIQAALSSYLMTATLGIIGAQALIVTFVLDKREGLFYFGLLSVLGFLSLLMSFLVGGWGVTELYKGGFSGSWTVSTRGKKFSKQTGLALFGTVLVVASTLCGRPRADEKTAEINELRKQIAAVEADVMRLRSSQSTGSSCQNIICDCCRPIARESNGARRLDEK